MNPAAASVPFEGMSGAINVSIVAFSIVFGVLFGLTVMIYAIRIFSGGSGPKPDAGKPSSGGAPAKAAPAPAAASAPAGNPQGKVVAAITAAILEATGGRGRVLAIEPAGPAASGQACQFGECRWTHAWRSSGVAALTYNQVDRAWRR